MFQEYRREFGAFLREHRQACDLSLSEAAPRLGLTKAKLHRIETGGSARIGSPTVLQAVADVYGVPVDEVFARAGLQPVPAEIATTPPSAQRSLPRQVALLLTVSATASAIAVNDLIAAGNRVLGVVPLPSDDVGVVRLLVVVERS